MYCLHTGYLHIAELTLGPTDYHEGYTCITYTAKLSPNMDFHFYTMDYPYYVHLHFWIQLLIWIRTQNYPILWNNLIKCGIIIFLSAKKTDFRSPFQFSKALWYKETPLIIIFIRFNFVDQWKKVKPIQHVSFRPSFSSAIETTEDYFWHLIIAHQWIIYAVWLDDARGEVRH
jgi:hypothetical protein